MSSHSKVGRRRSSRPGYTATMAPNAAPNAAPAHPKEEPSTQLHDEADLISFRSDALSRFITNQEYLENVTSKYVHTSKIIPPRAFPEPSELDKSNELYFGNLDKMKEKSNLLKEQIEQLRKESSSIPFNEEYIFQQQAIKKLYSLQNKLETKQSLEDLNSEYRSTTNHLKSNYKRIFKSYPKYKRFSANFNIDVTRAPENYNPESINSMINIQRGDPGLAGPTGDAVPLGQQMQVTSSVGSINSSHSYIDHGAVSVPMSGSGSGNGTGSEGNQTSNNVGGDVSNTIEVDNIGSVSASIVPTPVQAKSPENSATLTNSEQGPNGTGDVVDADAGSTAPVVESGASLPSGDLSGPTTGPSGAPASPIASISVPETIPESEPPVPAVNNDTTPVVADQAASGTGTSEPYQDGMEFMEDYEPSNTQDVHDHHREESTNAAGSFAMMAEPPKVDDLNNLFDEENGVLPEDEIMDDDMDNLINFQGDDADLMEGGTFDQDFLSQIDHSME
ncbi:hypothetical protein CAAN1_02S03004 [[Candida] anglica]|uniref:Uncharacterized protein n=1 Tax=[Candida] anglica TaxID=148631 RepID=A0ABP0E6A3_9ASCO